MKNFFKTTLAALALTLTLATTAHAGHDHPPTAASSPELNQIKALEGRWVTVTDMFGKKNQKVYTEYKVTAGGSAVLERFAPGTPQEMVSVYYDNKGKLAMTHYCIMQNRPALKLKSSTPDTIKLAVVKIDGLKAKDQPSMGDLTLHFKDKNHYEITCAARGKGHEHDKPMTSVYTRVK